MNNETETALLDAYLKQSRRYPGGVLAIGGDVVLMNPYLRQALDAADQTALLDHAAEMTRSVGHDHGGRHPAQRKRRSRCRPQNASPIAGPQRQHVVFHVSSCTSRESTPVARVALEPIPRLAGRSSSFRRSCQQVERCYRDRDWVVIEGETRLGAYPTRPVGRPVRHARTHHPHTPCRSLRHRRRFRHRSSRPKRTVTISRLSIANVDEPLRRHARPAGRGTADAGGTRMDRRDDEHRAQVRPGGHAGASLLHPHGYGAIACGIGSRISKTWSLHCLRELTRGAEVRLDA